ncbi:MAG: hypothetical protein R2750_04560 [Bacteroidales bacterium]
MFSFLWVFSQGAPVEANFELKETSTYVFEYTKKYADRNSTNNYFIKELARHNLTGLYNTSYTFHFSLEKRISKIEENTFEAEAILTGHNCTGNIYYKKFDISDILIPDKADFDIFIEDNGNYIARQSFRDIGRDDKMNFNFKFVFEAFDDNRKYNLIVDNITFYSVETDKQAFQERLRLVDDYYAAISALEHNIEKLETIAYAPSKIPNIFMLISEMERAYKSISNSEFITRLDIQSNDVSGFSGMQKKYLARLETAKFQFNKLLTTLDYINFTESLSELSRNHVAYANDFMNLSQNTSHTFQPYFYKLGKVDYSPIEMYDFKTGVEQIVRKSKFCNDSDIVFDRFKTEVFKAYLEKSEKLLKEEYFNLAKGVLENAERFYIATLGNRPPLELNIQLSRANYGIYNSYLHLIDRAIDIGNYELAENYINKAKIFQEEHSSTIISRNQIHKASEELIDLYINKGFRQIKSNEFEEALYCFEQAQSVCFSIGLYNHDYIIKHGLIQSRNGLYLSLLTNAEDKLLQGDDIAAKENMKEASALASLYPTQIHLVDDFDSLNVALNFQEYLTAISNGKKYLAENNYTMAYDKFLNALQIEEKSSFKIYEPLIDLFSEAATPYLVDQCRLGEIKVSKNKLTEAREIYDHCFQLQSDYGLFFEPDLMNSLTMLNNNIFTKKCENITDDFDEMIVEFNNLVDGGDFISAIEILDQTAELSKDNYYCDLDNSLVLNYRETYSPAAEYQELGREAQDALARQDQKRFNEIYQKMEQLSTMYEVIRTRVEPMPLQYLFSVKKNLALLETTINNSQSTEEYATALRILDVLENNNTSTKDAKSIQQKLAHKLACADKLNDSDADPKSNIDKYTGGNTWYKHFKKEYLKNW